MTPAKKRRLEAAGFNIGSADEFLSPSTAKPAAITFLRDIPEKTIARWIARDEAEMVQLTIAAKRKKK